MSAWSTICGLGEGGDQHDGHVDPVALAGGAGRRARRGGHAQVQQRHVGPVFDDEVQCGPAVAGFADDAVAAALHQGAHDAVAIDGMVVGDDDAQQPGAARRSAARGAVMSDGVRWGWRWRALVISIRSCR